MIELVVISGIVCVVIGLVMHAYGLANERDRTPLLWAALALGAAVAVAVVTWGALVGSLVSGSNVVAVTFAALGGPILAPLLVVQLLRRLPPGRPQVRHPVAVRLMGRDGEVGVLRVGLDGLRFESARATRHVPPGELGRVEADGECLIVGIRSSGEELRIHVIGFKDPWRRRRMCVALAAALTGGVPRATARPAD